MKDQEVAIKIINREHFDEPINKVLLEGELEILKMMRGCSNILHLHDIVKEGDFIYIVS